jgi:hypothetical protein
MPKHERAPLARYNGARIDFTSTDAVLTGRDGAETFTQS